MLNKSHFNYRGIIEVDVFAAEDMAEGIADEVCVTNHKVGAVMWMAVNPCGDVTVSNEVAEFCGVGGIKYISLMSIFDSCECRQMVCDNYYLFGITLNYWFFW